jgi:hypothetical protein
MHVALAAVVLLGAAAALLLEVLRQGRRLDARDPRIGTILYEDVAKPPVASLPSDEGSEPDPVEMLYYVDERFAVPAHGRTHEVRLVLQGKADRIVRKPDGAVHVIDYKSGEEKPDKLDYYQFQLIAYFFMVEQTLGEPPARAVIDFLDDLDDEPVLIDNDEANRAACLELIRELCAMKLGDIPEEALAELRREPLPAP